MDTAWSWRPIRNASGWLLHTLKSLEVNRLYVLQEGGGLQKNEALVPAKKKG